MIIFSSRKLEQSIADNRLASWAKAKYLIFTAVVMAVFYGPFYLVHPFYGESAPTLNSIFSLIFTIVGVFVTYYGIKECYATNRAVDDKDFLERFAILSVPVFVKVSIIVFPATLCVSMLMLSLRETHPMLSKRFPIILSLLGPLLFYIYYCILNRSFTRLGRVIEENENRR